MTAAAMVVVGWAAHEGIAVRPLHLVLLEVAGGVLQPTEDVEEYQRRLQNAAKRLRRAEKFVRRSRDGSPGTGTAQ